MSCFNTYVLRTKQLNIINYVYLLFEKESKQAVIVDPAWDYMQIYKLLNKLNAELKYILLTHSHYDHVNLADRLAKETSAKVYISDLEIMRYGFSCTNLEAIKENYIINVGKSRIKCILTPGHTYGSMCYITDTDFFTGDTVFNEGCGICETSSAARQLYYSLKKIKNNIDSELIVRPGHFYSYPMERKLGNLIKNNIYFLFENPEDFVEFRMRLNQTGLFDFK